MRRAAALLLALALAGCAHTYKVQFDASDSSPSPEVAKTEPGWVTWAQLDETARSMFDVQPPEQALDLWAELQSAAYNCVIGQLVETYPDRVTAEMYMAAAIADWRRSWELADAIFFSRPLVRVQDEGSAFAVSLAAACGGVAITKPDPQAHRDK